MERTGVRSSLTDINQVALFTDEFEMQKEIIEMEQQKVNQDLNRKLFEEELLAASDMNLIDKLFVENTTEMIVRNEQENIVNQMFSTTTSVVIIVVIFVCVILSLLGTKGIRKDDVNDKSEESGRK